MTKTELYGWIVLAVALAGLILAGVWDLFSRLWRVWRDRNIPGPGPYDWGQDDGLLNVWAREEVGQVMAVLPKWLWKIGGTREW